MPGRPPLEGLTVVSVEQAVAAPFCTARLADAGARVYKIERPDGDFARTYDDVAKGQSSYFIWLNRGKHSICIDLTTAAGKTELLRLVDDADVLVQNLRPGAMDRLGLGVSTLRARHPRLVTCSITGYGDGPYADRKAYDLLVQAESGLCAITGTVEPSRVGISVVDIATGATAYSSILEALVRRGVTGEGADITVSMFDVIAEWMTVPLLQFEGGQPPYRVGLAHPSIAPYGVFRSRDGADLLISIQNEREWRDFCAMVLDDAALASDPRFATNVLRSAHRTEVDKIVAAKLARLTIGDAVNRLSDADIAFATLNDMAGFASHSHLRRITVDTPAGPVALPAPAPIWAGERRHYGAVPALGMPSQN